jgi:cell division protein FtsN
LPGKRYKSRGFVISFGDIMLPLIGVVALGLLLLAGRFFFTSALQPNRASLPVMAQPRREKPAQTQERAASRVPIEGKAPPEKALPALPAALTAEAASSLPVMPDVLAIPYEEKKVSVSPERQKPVPPSKAEGPPKTLKTTKTSKTQPKPQPALRPPKPAAKVAVSSPVAKIPAPTPSAWMVQVAAFSTKSTANDVARRLSKDGHSARVVSGKTIHRVLIQAKDRNDASALATRMDRSGFPGAFVISPKQ